MGNSDHTWFYVDTPLLTRLQQHYDPFETRSDVLIIREDQLAEWLEAIKIRMLELNITPP